MTSRISQTILVAAAGTAMAFGALSTEQVEVTGTVPLEMGCYFDCSENLWNGSLEGGQQVIEVAAQATASERTEPACLEEALIKNDIIASINAASSGSTMPPGTIIMYNHQLEDPAYAGSKGADPNWVKYGVVAKWGRGANPPIHTIDMHYMYNLSTKKFEQLKFKNTPAQGCGIA